MKNVVVTVALMVLFASVAWTQNAEQQSGHPRQPMRIRVSPKLLDGLAVKRVLPQPPWTTDKTHQSGTAMVDVVVDRDGTVKDAHYAGGDTVLGEVAAQAIKQWQFRPFVIEGTPVQVLSRVTMKFTKDRAEVVLPEQ